MGKRGQRGNIVIIFMFLLFFAGLVGGAIFIFQPNELDESGKKAADARAAYDEAVASLERALKNQKNIDISLDRNANTFSCLFSGPGECRGKGGTFLMYDSAQTVRPVSHLANDQGADSLGISCKGYPSADCPLRVETVWEPVCGTDRCEGTKSFRVKSKVTLMPVIGAEAPLEWTREDLFSPQLQLSRAVICERGGGTWANTECLTPSQVAERQIASSKRAETQAVNANPEGEDGRDSNEAPPLPPQYECPNQIVVQGQYYPVHFLSADRGQVSVPAMSCQLNGFVDVFVFQCAAKTPATFPNEGQWIQVEAVMAPPCDQDGQPIGTSPRF